MAVMRERPMPEDVPVTVGFVSLQWVNDGEGASTHQARQRCLED
jgi:hypothetical protein